jgi:multiple sugar transport system ATP-binding protein
MGRAIVREPQAFLMDEPLSNLDAKLRVQMRAEIARIQRNLGVTTIYVTHDQTEAMTLGHRVAVMRKGVLQQVDGPQVLYDRPVNLFVAGFIGSPAMNLVEARLEESDGGFALVLGSQRLPVPAELLGRRPALRRYLGEKVIVGIRPEDMEDAALAEGPTVEAAVDLVEAMGSDVVVHLRLDAPAADVTGLEELQTDLDATAMGPATGTEVVARFSPRTRVRAGDRVAVRVDTDRLHVFDPGSGLAVWDGAEG